MNVRTYIRELWPAWNGG